MLRRNRIHERQETPPAIEFVPPPEPWPGWPVGWSTAWNGQADYVALRSAIVFRCVDLISGAICSLPLGQFTLERTPVEPPAAWVLNPQPELYASRRDALAAVVTSLLIRGNAYLFVTARYFDGYPQRWVVLNPDKVNIRSGNDGLPVYEIDGERVPSDLIVHIRHQTRPGSFYGYGPLDAAADNVLGVSAAEKWSSELLSKGLMPQGVLTHPDQLSDKQSAELRAQWEAMPGLVRVLSGGIQFESPSLNAKDAMLLERMEFDGRAIATAFGIPAHIVNLAVGGAGLHYSSSEMDIRALWQTCLNPIADNMEQAFSGMLPGRQFVQFDEYSYLAGNYDQQVANAVALVGAGIWTVNEAREKFGKAPLSDSELAPPRSSTVAVATSGVTENPAVESADNDDPNS